MERTGKIRGKAFIKHTGANRLNRGKWRGGCGYIGMAGCIYVCLIKGYVCV